MAAWRGATNPTQSPVTAGKRNVVPDGGNVLSDGGNVVPDGGNVLSDGGNVVSDGDRPAIKGEGLVVRSAREKVLSERSASFTPGGFPAFCCSWHKTGTLSPAGRECCLSGTGDSVSRTVLMWKKALGFEGGAVAFDVLLVGLIRAISPASGLVSRC